MSSRSSQYAILWTGLLLLFLALAWKTGLFDRSEKIIYPRSTVITTRLSMSLSDMMKSTTLEDPTLIQEMIDKPISAGTCVSETFIMDKESAFITVKPSFREEQRYRVSPDWKFVYVEATQEYKRVDLQKLREYVEARE